MTKYEEREKLIDLIREGANGHTFMPTERIADHLLANGVTLKSECEACGKAASDTIVGLQEIIKELRDAQRLIPVPERLPEKEGLYLVWISFYFTPDHADGCKHYDGVTLAYYEPDFGFRGHAAKTAKAWAYLPKQSKEE